ncbi:hypothetical protein BG011_006189 [Mortierella polycephala]|uniref:BHLH domain-containing protein n=1 Tax=Mortierella polycephala TaxID=41804 RepID=A0A9P6U0D6_9FUNG|nr:hypothetical protein BG011_006189 [Mortierella polycephala]
MAFNFDSAFSLDQAGLEFSLNDFTFDPSQANQVQHQLQQQQQQDQQQELHSLLLQDGQNNISSNTNTMQSQGPTTSVATTGSFDFHPSALTTEMLVAASASTTPVFPMNPDKANQQQQQVFLQQQQLHQQLQQQQRHLQQQQQQLSQDQLLTPAGSDYYSTDYTQYMSPLGIQADTTEAAMVVSDQLEDDEVFFTPLISPAMTPSHTYSSLPHALSTSNEIFSPLTSPALQPHRSSTVDYLSFSAQSFSPLPLQFHQTQSTQQQQLHQLQSQPQTDLTQQFQQQQLVNDLQQQQFQSSQASINKHARIDAQSPALNARRPSIKRKTTVERVTNGLNSTGSRPTGPVRVALPKSSPALRPLTHPMSPATLRKQQASRGRSTSIAPASPLIMHFPTNRPSPSPLLIATSQPPSSQISQPSPSPRLMTNMHQLSMMPSSPMGAMGAPATGPQSPAFFSLPASSMMPPPRSPMILPSANQSTINTPRQLSLVPAPQQVLVRNQHQLSIHQPISISQSSPALQPMSEIVSAASETFHDQGDFIQITAPCSTPGSSTPKSALAPVTPASLMNLGAGSGSESTPTSSPKFGVHAKSKSSLHSSTMVDCMAIAGNEETTSGISGESPISSSISTSSSQKRGTKRQANGDMVHGSGTLAPSTPRQVPLTPGTPRQVPLTPGATAMSPMPPPANGFALISPALKPTLMPQHRGSQSMLVSPRLQPHLVSPSLKPWLPGVSTTEAMARLATKSNYQNILDGDHTALGLSYNTDLHSGIELRRTSHKAAEQKRRDSLKHCFDDLRQIIPNIQEKSPSKVFLLKKSFDYICNLKSESAKRDLELARIRAEYEFMKNAMQAWWTTLPEDSPLKKSTAESDSKDLIESWKMPEKEIQKATAREVETAIRAAEVAEMSAAAVEAARTQPGGQNKGGRESQGDGDGDDSDEDVSFAPKSKKTTSSKTASSASAAKCNTAVIKKTKTGKDGDIAMSDATSDPSSKTQQTAECIVQSTKADAKRREGSNEDDNDDDGDQDDQEMVDATATNIQNIQT